MADQQRNSNNNGEVGLATRRELKGFFTPKKPPAAQQFAKLIDSTYNLNYQGFNMSVEHGFEVSTSGEFEGLLGLYVAEDSQAGPQAPLWSIKVDEPNKSDTHGHPNLTFVPDRAEADRQNVSSADTGTETFAPALTLSRKGGVGVQTKTPDFDLDINGSMSCKTRLGTVPLRQVGDDGPGEQENVPADQPVPVPADGNWHNITAALGGCQAFEVMAGVGKKDTGRYALLHAVALSTFNPTGWLFNFLQLKNRIKCRHSYYRSRSDKLALRWSGSDRHYFLQIRSNGNYGVGPQGEPVRINYHITKLWIHPMMTLSSGVKADSR